MNILVTGGAGYVGHFVTKKLLDLGHFVTVLDNLSYGNKGLEEFVGRERFNFILGDICDLKDVVKVVKGKDAVIALAAIVGDPACNLDPDETINTNFLSTKILVDVCEHYGVKRIVFASSCSVYGDTKNLVADEDFVLNPLSLYAKTRVMSEACLLKSPKSISPVILRLATVFGYSDRMRFDLVVNFLTAKAHFKRGFTIFGGDQWRPLVHVQDVAEAFVKAALSADEKVDRKVFNVGSSKNNLTIERVGNIVSRVIPEAIVEMEREVEDKRNYRVSFERLERDLGITCTRSVEDGVKEIVEHLGRGKIGNFEDDIYYNVRYIYKFRNGS